MNEETRIQRRVIKWARKKGVPSVRLAFRYGAAAGWPDVLFLIPGGKPLFIEFKKSPDEEPRKLQQYRMGQLEKLGYDVLATGSENEARDAITQALGTV